MQQAQNLALAAAAGATNLKVTSVDGLVEGGPIVVGNTEILTIKQIGTPGATTLQFPAGPGTRTLVVVSAMNFTPGQEVLVDDEPAVVAEVFFPRGTLAAPLKAGYPAGAAVASAQPTPGAANRY